MATSSAHDRRSDRRSPVSCHVRLSYDVSEGAPGWPGNPTYHYEPVTSTANGDVANVGVIHLCNHFGTHVDAPRHFNPEGLLISEVPLERFVYDRVAVIDISKEDLELVTREDLEPASGMLASAEMLLLRSGWSSVRSSDPERYTACGPGVSADACEYLIDGFPHLKAIGLDWLSLATPQRIEEGIAAHRVLCGVGRGDRYVLIIEDLDLSRLPVPVQRIYALPLFVTGADSSPCTVIAEASTG